MREGLSIQPRCGWDLQADKAFNDVTQIIEQLSASPAAGKRPDADHSLPISIHAAPSIRHQHLRTQEARVDEDASGTAWAMPGDFQPWLLPARPSDLAPAAAEDQDEEDMKQAVQVTSGSN